MKITQLQKLCPYIAHLSLSVPLTINSSGNIDANVTPCVAILDALSKSDLPLRILELQHFPYCESFEGLLDSKGARLQEMLFRALTHLTSKHLMFIGDKCKNLQKLDIKELGPEPEEEAFNYTTTASILNKKLFCSLQVLRMSGRSWNPKVVLPLMLMSATKLTKLSLLNMSSRMSMDQAWNRVLEVNKLSQMASISLYGGCFVSMALVRKLTLECPRLSFFSFIQSENIDLAEVERLRLEVASKNLNIQFQVLEMFEV